MPTVQQESVVPVSADELYRWHARPGAFLRLTPPWNDLEILEATGGVETGARRVFKVCRGPVSITWEAEHTDHVEGRKFVDEQIRGPFRRWVHTHRFEPEDDGESRLVDHIEYELPLGPLGEIFGGKSARETVEKMMAFRHRRTREDLMRHAGVDDELCVAVTGSSGLIGSALCAFLSTGGHEVIRLVRDRSQVGDQSIYWSPEEGAVDTEGLEGVDAVVHLAGESLGGGEWTGEKRRKIRESRIEGTRLLADAVTRLDDGPSVFVSASTVCYYGDRGDEVLTEDSEPGSTFLAEMARDWERACRTAKYAGIRTVNARIGIVLTPRGGTLERMIPLVKFGMANRLGQGSQYVGWVDLDDVVGALSFAMLDEALEGPVNITAPEPVTNRELIETLGDIVSRPNALPFPGRVVERIMGRNMARETVLASQRAVPAKLTDTGFEFYYDDLEESLAVKLGTGVDEVRT